MHVIYFSIYLVCTTASSGVQYCNKNKHNTKKATKKKNFNVQHMTYRKILTCFLIDWCHGTERNM